MLEEDRVHKEGLPPRGHNAEVLNHANHATLWTAGVVAVLTLLGLVMFGAARMNDTTASNPNFDTESAATRGAALTSPSKSTE